MKCSGKKGVDPAVSMLTKITEQQSKLQPQEELKLVLIQCSDIDASDENLPENMNESINTTDIREIMENDPENPSQSSFQHENNQTGM